MKHKAPRVITILLILVAGITLTVNGQSGQKNLKDAKGRKEKADRIQLFNGKDLSNWVFKLKDPAVDPSTVFNVNNGVIHIAGNPFGYMRTKDSYSDYLLHVEWRWPSEATNSGVFVHAQLPDSIWLKCIECQLQAGNAGDFICMSGADMNELKDKSKKVVKKMAASSEKPAGEWNTMEVTCMNNAIVVYVNGVLQNKGTNLSVSKGSVCLQSEGKDVEFRNVYLTKLKVGKRKN
ncbi:MAG: DUF1080 domain-containing protein [Bacteroidales bacterium]